MVANTLGLNDSKYQYVIDALEADEIREKREQRDKEDRRQVSYSSGDAECCVGDSVDAGVATNTFHVVVAVMGEDYRGYLSSLTFIRIVQSLIQNKIEICGTFPRP